MTMQHTYHPHANHLNVSNTLSTKQCAVRRRIGWIRVCITFDIAIQVRLMRE